MLVDCTDVTAFPVASEDVTIPESNLLPNKVYQISLTLVESVNSIDLNF